MLVLMAGLPGTGKSTIARALSARLGAVVLDKDRIRAALFPPDRIEYSTPQDDFCQRVMLQTAEYLLAQDRSQFVFLDGRPFSRRYQREQVVECARGLSTPWAILECTCREATALARLERDAIEGVHPARNRDADLYRRVRAAFEPIEEPRLLIDTDQPLQDCVGQALRYLGAA